MAKKPRCNVKRMSSEMLCDLPYTLRIDYSAKGQKGDVREVRVPGHFIEKVVEDALALAWARGYDAAKRQLAA